MNDYYILPVQIANQKLHYLKLTNNAENSSTKILTASDNRNALRFLNGSELVYMENGRSRTIEVENISISIEKGKKGTDFNIRLSEKTENDDVNENNLQLPAINDTNGSEIVISIEFEDKSGKIYYDKLNIQYINNSDFNIFDIVLDFGSEASQMVISKRGAAISYIQRVKLLEEFKKYFYNSETVNYFQEEIDSELLKSICFVKSKNANEYETLVEPGSDKEKNNLIKCLMPNDVNAILEYLIIGNLKLANLGSVPNKSIQITSKSGNYQAQLLNKLDSITIEAIQYFLYLAITSISKRREVQEENKKSIIVFNLLVPNILSQPQLTKLKTELLAKLELFKSDNDWIAGYDFRSYSESDAAFMGLLNQKDLVSSEYEIQRNMHYLIIDCGKGTTDFSILKTGDNPKDIFSIFRSGFVGAGNTISFAFAKTLIRNIFAPTTEEEFKKVFKRLFENSLYSDKLKFVDIIEDIKKNYSIKNEISKSDLYESIFTNDKNPIRKDELELPKFVEILESNKTKIKRNFRDKYDYIKEAVKLISEDIYKQITNVGLSEFDTIYLSGRSFLFKPLLEAVKSGLRNNATNGKIVFIEKNPKRVSLMGPLSNQVLNYGLDVIGRPLFAEQQGNKKIKVKAKKGGWFEEILRKGERWLIDDGNDLNDTSDNSKPNTEIDTFFLKGDSHTINSGSNYNYFINLSGKNHPIDIVSGHFKIIFTGDNFYVKKGQNINAIEDPRRIAHIDKMLQMTQFPFSESYRDVDFSIENSTNDDVDITGNLFDEF